jgi:SAM-dependent methyltransferase
MGGVSLALERWRRDPFYQRVFRGRVLDCGGGGDPFAAVAYHFPAVTEVVTADLEPGPAPAVQCDLNTWAPDPDAFDCVLSSHTLEHLTDPTAAVYHWWRAVKPNGYLILIVPDYRTYERENWPSSRNSDHKTAWNLLWAAERHERALLDLSPFGYLHRATTLDDGFDPHDYRDQTGTSRCECGLEAVWWRRP